jgi:hypothetical protein
MGIKASKLLLYRGSTSHVCGDDFTFDTGCNPVKIGLSDFIIIFFSRFSVTGIMESGETTQ